MSPIVDLSIHPSGIVPTLQNVVATVNLDCRLDLRQIALSARNAEYNPKRFSTCDYENQRPKNRSLDFYFGKDCLHWSETENQAKVAARKYARVVQKIGLPVKFTNFKIQNIVASCDVKFPIKLEKISSDYYKYVSYEPELFPGLVYRVKEPKVVMLIFVSRKVVITGSKRREDTYSAFEQIYPVICLSRK